MKIYGMIAIMVLCACAFVAGCGHRDPIREYLEAHGESIEIAPKAEPQKVSFTTKDKVEFSADYYPGRGEKPAGVILQHEFLCDSSEWDTLIDDLVAKGYAVLVPDWVFLSFPPYDADADAFIEFIQESVDKNAEASINFLEEQGIPSDRIVIVHNNDFACNIAPACKGVIALESLFDLPEKQPGKTHVIYQYDSSDFDGDIRDRKDIIIRKKPLPPTLWIMAEVRASDPAATRAQADIIGKRLTDLNVNHVIRIKDDGTIRIFAPEAAYEDVDVSLKPGKLEFKIEIDKKTGEEIDPAHLEYCPVMRCTERIYRLTVVEKKPLFVESDIARLYPIEGPDNERTIGFELTAAAMRRLEETMKNSSNDLRWLIALIDGNFIDSVFVASIEEGRGTIILHPWDYQRARPLLVAIPSEEPALDLDKTRYYLIASTGNGKAVAVHYKKNDMWIWDFRKYYRKYYDNENILCDIESILAAKK